MEIFGVISLFFGALWLIFLFSASRFMGKQREANRQIVAALEGIESSLKRIDQYLESANKMHGDLNRAAQWLIDRQSGH
jgi:F0F1-type ATP synthase membrane subunit b/b'